MRWLRRSSEPPQLLGLSPLRTDDSLSTLDTLDHNQNKIHSESVSDIFRNRTPNHSTRKSRIDTSTPSEPPSTPSWSIRLTKSTENCYSIQQGRVIERSSKSRFVSPVRIKNKNCSSIRSTSPAQSITSIRSILTSTPTHKSLCNVNYVSENDSNTLNWRVLQREKVTADADEADKGEGKDLENNRSQRKKSEFCRAAGGYSVPYREKRNVLSSTRLSCYKPASTDKKFDISNLKNYKSVDDFLSFDETKAQQTNDADNLMVSMPFITSSKDLRMNFEESQETPKMNHQPQDGPESIQRMKKAGISSKLRSMSDKTHKLFSKLYSSSNMKSSTSSSTDVCNDFIISRPSKPAQPSNIVNSRRSLSYGMLPGVNEFEVKKIETEDGDSGILVNESGASSMVETDSSSDEQKTEIEVVEEKKEWTSDKTVNHSNVITPHTTSSDDSQPQPKNDIFDLSACRHSSSSDQILSPTSSSSFVTKRLRNLSMDGLNERQSSDESAPKRNSIVSEIVAMIEKNETKFNTMKNPRRSKPSAFGKFDSPEPCAISISNLCDDDKLKLKSLSKEKICDTTVEPIRITLDDDLSTNMKSTSNFCTLPRRTKTSSHCTFLTVAFEKGPGKKSLGFTIVGGADSPRGALGIFIKSIMPNGQAIESGQLRAGDEILAVNGQVCHDLTHQDAVRLFKSVRSGEVVLNICRRRNNVCVK